MADVAAAEKDGKGKYIGYHYTNLKGSGDIGVSNMIQTPRGRVYFSTMPMNTQEVQEKLVLGREWMSPDFAYMVSFGPPFFGVGAGISGSKLTTNTWTLRT